MGSLTFIHNSRDGGIKFKLSHDHEGWYDCILIDFLDYPSLMEGDRVYNPSIIVFYEYINKDGDEISYRGADIEDFYSFTEDGYGEGFYVNKDTVEHSEIFNAVRDLIEKEVDNDKYLEELWQEFANIALDEDENIDEDFHRWSKGTDRMEIWHWFDRHHSKGLAVGLMDLEPNK